MSEREELIKRLQQGIEYPSPSSADPYSEPIVILAVEDAKAILAAIAAPQQEPTEPVAWHVYKPTIKADVFAQCTVYSLEEANKVAARYGATIRPLIYGDTAPPSGMRAGMLRAAEIVQQGLIPLSDYLKIQNHVVKRDVDREQGLLNSLAAAITSASDQINVEGQEQGSGATSPRAGMMLACIKEIITEDCPLPIGDDHSISACVTSGKCGCVWANHKEAITRAADQVSQPDTVAVPIDALVALRSRDVMTRVMIDKHGVSISGWHVPQPAFSQFVPPAIFNILEPYDDHGGSVKAALTRAIQRAAQEAK